MNGKVKTSNHGNITFKEFETENFRICAKDKVQQDMIDGYFLLTLHTIFNLPDLGIIYHKYGIDKYLTKEEVIELRDVLTEIIEWWNEEDKNERKDDTLYFLKYNDIFLNSSFDLSEMELSKKSLCNYQCLNEEDLQIIKISNLSEKLEEVK